MYAWKICFSGSTPALSGRFASSSPKWRALGKAMNFVWTAKVPEGDKVAARQR